MTDETDSWLTEPAIPEFAFISSQLMITFMFNTWMGLAHDCGYVMCGCEVKSDRSMCPPYLC